MTQSPTLQTVSSRSETFWHSLRYFAAYRLIVAAVFLLAAFFYGGFSNLGLQDMRLFRWVSFGYLLAGTGFLWFMAHTQRAFDLQLSAQVMTDIFALTLLMFASGGARSGIEVMIFVVLAGASLVGQGRLTLFYAAVATLALLLEQAYRLLKLGGDLSDFFLTGLISTGYFGTAVIVRLLARRVVINEELARERGIELANQMQINLRVIRDMQDGVLVIDRTGSLKQFNPQAEVLLDANLKTHAQVTAFSEPVAEKFSTWIQNPQAATEFVFNANRKRHVRARMLPPSEGGDVLIYLEDLERIQVQAQQLKLAALGRLTANLAHEIRNPLSAISHAAELLEDETAADKRLRLIRIIGDNTNRLNRLVMEVLELGRRDRAQAEEFDLELFLRQFLDEFALNQQDTSRRIIMNITPGIHMKFDRTHLHRVLWNLLVNALRHASSASGSVRVTARESQVSDRCEIHIVDDGPGINEAQRHQVFEPFFTTQGTGTGLGLFIARELCEANQARLDLLDDEGGAHFRILGRRGAWSKENAES
jgi:two-component system sensor histidine kinase PilS (NtrC family)